LTKKLTEIQKKQIVNLFYSGYTLDDLAIEFNCTKLTISRNLKKNIGDEKFKDLIKKNNFSEKELKEKIIKNNINKDQNQDIYKEEIKSERDDYEFISETQFVEITPLDYEIENIPQKDLSSVKISEIEFPKVVYMIVDKKIELVIKLLRDYPEWQFLSQEELKRKTIEIYDDLKNAKRICNKEQKVIKVPNTDVFKIAAPILLSRGISRIVSAEKLIAL
tara:strand:+ start:149 stop:808 length:660 start_codon:yes stop_codon:yes gene_type:complete